VSLTVVELLPSIFFDHPQKKKKKKKKSELDQLGMSSLCTGIGGSLNMGTLETKALTKGQV
jgi:hypothetical protein